jgi:rod shape-determining protein MreD
VKWRQVGLISITMVVAAVLQVSFLTRIGLPGAAPDLVVVTVVAFALAMGPVPGAFAGFLGGLVVDISPPADTIVGVHSILYLAIGFVVGYAVDARDRTMLAMVGSVALACGAAVLGTAVMDAMLGSPRVLWSEVPILTLTSTLYGGLLGRVMVPFAAWLTRRFALDDTVDNV